MKVLLVIDMQEDYVGTKRNKKRFPYDGDTLIARINQRISEVQEEGNQVIYIVNRFFYQSKKFKPQLVAGLQLVSDAIFLKNKVSCFSNPKLLLHLQNIGAKELEMVGVDGNYCVAASALDGTKNGFSVTFNLPCIEAGNQEKLTKTVEKLKISNVKILNEQRS